MKPFLFILFFLPVLIVAQTPSAGTLYGEGVRAYYSGDYETALYKYNDALQLKPNTIGYLYNRGLTYIKLNHENTAIIDFQKVISLDSNYIDAWYQMGMIKMANKKYEEASALFMSALGISARHIPSLHQMGILYYYRRLNTDATDMYNRILDIDPKDEQAYYRRGLAKFNASDFEGTVKDMSAAYRLNANNTQAIEQRAIAYQRLNDIDHACQDWHLLLLKNNPRAQGSISTFCK